jgi:hypothetical protein
MSPLTAAERQSRYRPRHQVEAALLATRPANLFIRACVADCLAIVHGPNIQPEDIAERQWGRDVALYTKAATSTDTTSTSNTMLGMAAADSMRQA